MLHWKTLETRLGPELALRYGASLKGEMPRRLEEAHEALGRRDAHTLERAAHSLKGMCANLGVSAARAAALAVEEAARTMDWQHLPALVASMAQETAAVLAALDVAIAQAQRPDEEGYMRILVAEDDFSARLVLHHLLKDYGTVDVAVDGREAVEAFHAALAAGEPYRLVCLDIMMPEMDGQEALRQMRALEAERGILSSRGAKIVMTTALDDPKTVVEAFKGLCDTYLVKPIDKEALRLAIARVGLLEE
jgi:two-component system chemotaxis response regulator CheY